jgi:hypothetical protein
MEEATEEAEDSETDARTEVDGGRGGSSTTTQSVPGASAAREGGGKREPGWEEFEEEANGLRILTGGGILRSFASAEWLVYQWYRKVSAAVLHAKVDGQRLHFLRP